MPRTDVASTVHVQKRSFEIERCEEGAEGWDQEFELGSLGRAGFLLGDW